jgi:cation transport ATPase
MAQVVLMDGSLKNLDYVFDISKQLNRNLKQSLSLSTGFGVMNFTGASLLQVGVNTSTMLFSLFFTSGIAHTMLPLRRKSVPPKIGDGK